MNLNIISPPSTWTHELYNPLSDLSINVHNLVLMAIPAGIALLGGIMASLWRPSPLIS